MTAYVQDRVKPCLPLGEGTILPKTLAVLRTPHLLLWPYTPAHQGWFVATFTDPMVMKHVDGALAAASPSVERYAGIDTN